MSVTPILIMNGLLLVISVGLLVSDEFLLDFGSCTITLTQEDKQDSREVEAGDNLLTYLNDMDDVEISSSCGGKGSCGYCKVRVPEGGGEVLPTEKIFMDRQELMENTRLACQVKVRNDLEVFIPDYLEIVKDMVENETYDPATSWRFSIADRSSGPKYLDDVLEYDEKSKLDEILAEHQGRGNLVALLQELNDQFGYLAEPMLAHVSEAREVPLERLYWMASFYDVFNLSVRGQLTLNVCTGTSCYVKGAGELLEAIEDELGIAPGETTEDGRFSLNTVSCVGCCGQAPVVEADGEIHGYLDRNKVQEVVDSYR